MSSLTPQVQSYYTRPDFTESLLRALRSAGKDTDALTRDDLLPFEEFHIRGRDATREMAELAELSPGAEVLDIGSGIGGPARTLAAEFKCRVTGLDLVEEFCRAATELTHRVGLADLVNFVQGDALNLPFPDQYFDAVLLEHMNMNVADKPRLFGEAARVLRRNGPLALYEICAGEAGPPHFPLPWANSPAISFLVTPQVLRNAAEQAGLRVSVWHDVSEKSREGLRAMQAMMTAPRPENAPPPLGLNLLLGPETPLKIGNLIQSIEENRARVVQAVLRR